MNIDLTEVLNCLTYIYNGKQYQVSAYKVGEVIRLDIKKGG